uniref:Vacuole membrane protein 1 n=1 Tax=Setaria digitata TaxID=48799 RepID=A0A915PZD1_9BILA
MRNFKMTMVRRNARINGTVPKELCIFTAMDMLIYVKDVCESCTNKAVTDSGLNKRGKSKVEMESEIMGKKKRSNAHHAEEVPSAPSASASPLVRQVTFDESSKESSDYYMKPSGRGLITSPSIGTLNRLERQKIVLWKRPFQTVHYAGREIFQLLVEFITYLWKHKARILFILLLCVIGTYVCHLPGSHQKYIESWKMKSLRCLYWVGLGILSSIGLGTGLHTFILYLGPHIASVTMAAYECNSLDFPEPPYPDRILCPNVEGIMETAIVTMWSIMSKVRIEALMWGAGTALGELPPYFMAKAARISGEEPDDEEYREFLAYINQNGPRAPTFTEKCKGIMEKAVTRLGFFGILSFASIPNPFFDLAGITCGHFLVPFWKFFLATLIGKAVFKMHLQMFFVVLAFSENTVEHLIVQLKAVPVFGIRLHQKLMEYVAVQKTRLYRNNGATHIEDSTVLQKGASFIVTSMIAWFLLSIINSLAQKWHKRLCDAKKKAQ